MARGRHNDLRRRGARREPRRKFTLFCEGKNTEPEYFDALRRLCSGALIEIRIEAAAGVPQTIARKAAAEAKALRKARKDSYEEGDEVWAVFDRDEHPNFEDAISICHNANVSIARSNPCFELWLVLHFQDYDSPAGRHKLQKYLKTLCPEYKPKGKKTVNSASMILAIEDAEARAARQLAAREAAGEPFGEPSTTVGKLTSAIRAAARRFVR